MLLSIMETACYSQSSSDNKPNQSQSSIATNSEFSTNNLPPECSTSCLRLIKDPQNPNNKNKLENPIYKLEAYLNGKQYYSFDAVSGRAFTQNRDRNQSGTEAPLPNGRYSVSSKTIPGSIAEAGETFLLDYPQRRNFSQVNQYLSCC